MTYPNGRVEHFKHDNAANCDETECEARAEEILKGAITPKMRMPLFLKKKQDGTFYLTIGFPYIPESKLQELKKRRYEAVTISKGPQPLIVVPLTTFRNTNETTYIELPEPISCHAQTTIAFTGNNVQPVPAGDVIPTWPNRLDWFGNDTCNGAVFKPKNNMSEKLQTGTTVKAGEDCLVLVKKTVTSKSHTEKELIKLGAKRLGPLRFKNKSTALFIVYQITMPASQQPNRKLDNSYDEVSSWMQEACGIMLEDPDACEIEVPEHLVPGIMDMVSKSKYQKTDGKYTKTPSKYR